MSDENKKDLTEQVEDSKISFSELAAKNQKKSAMDRITTIVLLLICVALAIYFIFGSVGSRQHALPPSAAESSSINVQVSSAELGRFESYTRLNGEIGSYNSAVSILPDTSGTVTSILVKRGSTVKKGDVIAYIDPSRPGQSYQENPVTSPIDGEITSVPVSVGETVSASTAIAVVSGEKSLYIETSLPERYVGNMSVGMPALVHSVAFPDKTFNADVSYISPSIDTSTRTAAVELELTGDSSGLMEGMYVSVDLVTEAHDNVVMIPSSAVSQFGGETVVYVAEDGKASMRQIVTGSDNGTMVIAESGIEAGDLLITAGTVADGSAINVL